MRGRWVPLIGLDCSGEDEGVVGVVDEFFWED